MTLIGDGYILLKVLVNDWTPKADRLYILGMLWFESELEGFAFFNLFIFLWDVFWDVSLTELIFWFSYTLEGYDGYSIVSFFFISIYIDYFIDALLGNGWLTCI